MTTAVASPQRWRARPVLAAVVRTALLAVPLIASSVTVYALARLLPPSFVRSWWALVAILAAAWIVAAAVERAARRLLPIALMLQLSMIFPDRAPSRLRLARAATRRRRRRPPEELLWTGRGLRPTSTSELIDHLVSALGTHDRRTRGHCERVRQLSDILAGEVGLDRDARERLRWAALLHDVGKVEVASSILNKPGRLNTGEFDRVKLHPAAGAALAAPLLPWLGTWGEGIVDHHEKYDGTGYPNGKAGEEISTAGRLIGVIDAFETMTAARPYKRAVATRVAREELARCAGTHFDPVFVRAFLAISMPRLLWAMGPLSFLLQLPYLAPLAQAGARGATAAPQAAAAVAAGAAGAVLSTGAVTGPPAVAAPPAPTAADLLLEPEELPGPVADVGQRRDRPVPVTPGRGTSTTQAAATAPGAPGAPVGSAAGTSAGAVDDSASAEEERGAPVSSRAPGEAPAPDAPDTSAADEERRADQNDGNDADESEKSEDGSEQPEDSDVDERDADERGARGSSDVDVFVSGPPATTSSRTVAFELADEAGAEWECQLVAAADGTASRWEPCSGRFTITVVRDGEHVLRVRDADTRNQLDTWTWTVAQ